MADLHAFFYNAVNGDRTYDADSFSNWLRKFFTTGVFEGDLQVLASAEADMNVHVQTGYANIDGKVMMYEAITDLAVETAHSTYGRIDTVVVERNDSDRDFFLKVVTGSPASSPTATAPVRSNGIYQIVLAEIYVEAGATNITQEAITDKRTDTTVCGIVTGTVEEYDFDQFKVQFDSFLANYSADVAAQYESYVIAITTYETTAESEFQTWFDKMKGQLSEDAAGKLQLQIDDLKLLVLGLVSKETNFPSDSQIVETYADGMVHETIFNADDSITETFTDSTGVEIGTKVTTFPSETKIIEEVQ